MGRSNGGGSASVIKSIQRGTVAASTLGTDVTISPVDMSKSFANYLGGTFNNINPYQAYMVLVNSTTIRIYSCANSMPCSWEVVEYV